MPLRPMTTGRCDSERMPCGDAVVKGYLIRRAVGQRRGGSSEYVRWSPDWGVSVTASPAPPAVNDRADTWKAG
jgi:hypothetical protein